MNICLIYTSNEGRAYTYKSQEAKINVHNGSKEGETFSALMFFILRSKSLFIQLFKNPKRLLVRTSTFCWVPVGPSSGSGLRMDLGSSLWNYGERGLAYFTND